MIYGSNYNIATTLSHQVPFLFKIGADSVDYAIQLKSFYKKIWQPYVQGFEIKDLAHKHTIQNFKDLNKFLATMVDNLEQDIQRAINDVAKQQLEWYHKELKNFQSLMRQATIGAEGGPDFLKKLNNFVNDKALIQFKPNVDFGVRKPSLTALSRERFAPRDKEERQEDIEQRQLDIAERQESFRKDWYEQPFNPEEWSSFAHETQQTREQRRGITVGDKNLLYLNGLSFPQLWEKWYINTLMPILDPLREIVGQGTFATIPKGHVGLGIDWEETIEALAKAEQAFKDFIYQNMSLSAAEGTRYKGTDENREFLTVFEDSILAKYLHLQEEKGPFKKIEQGRLFEHAAEKIDRLLVTYQPSSLKIEEMTEHIIDKSYDKLGLEREGMGNQPLSYRVAAEENDNFLLQPQKTLREQKNKVVDSLATNTWNRYCDAMSRLVTHQQNLINNIISNKEASLAQKNIAIKLVGHINSKQIPMIEREAMKYHDAVSYAYGFKEESWREVELYKLATKEFDSFFIGRLRELLQTAQQLRQQDQRSVSSIQQADDVIKNIVRV